MYLHKITPVWTVQGWPSRLQWLLGKRWPSFCPRWKTHKLRSATGAWSFWSKPRKSQLSMPIELSLYLVFMFIFCWHLFILKSCYDSVSAFCKPVNSYIDWLVKNMHIFSMFCDLKQMNDLFWNGYLAQVSDSKYTLENSASITRTDADAENRLSWKRFNVHILNIRKFMVCVFNEAVIQT